MVIVNSALKKDFIISTLEAYIEKCTFKHIKTVGSSIYFDTNIDSEVAIGIAKEVIKGTDLGKVLYFQVRALDE